MCANGARPMLLRSSSSMDGHRILCWRKQYESQLADAFHLVAFDLRGHGMSEAPEAREHYTEPQSGRMTLPPSSISSA